MRTSVLLFVLFTTIYAGCVSKETHQKHIGMLQQELDEARGKIATCSEDLQKAVVHRDAARGELSVAQNQLANFGENFIMGQNAIYISSSTGMENHPLFENPTDKQSIEQIFIAAYMAGDTAAHTVRILPGNIFPQNADDCIFVTMPENGEDESVLAEIVAECEQSCDRSRKRNCQLKCLKSNTEYLEFSAHFAWKKNAQIVSETTVERQWGETTYEYFKRAFEELKRK